MKKVSRVFEGLRWTTIVALLILLALAITAIVVLSEKFAFSEIILVIGAAIGIILVGIFIVHWAHVLLGLSVLGMGVLIIYIFAFSQSLKNIPAVCTLLALYILAGTSYYIQLNKFQIFLSVVEQEELRERAYDISCFLLDKIRTTNLENQVFQIG